MSDLSTFAGFKNWLIVIGFGVIVTLLSMVAANNRDNIEENEERITKLEGKVEELQGEVLLLKANLASQERESNRRLLEIERKWDRIDRTDRYKKQVD